jgi:putative hydrolase of the HAD superfamily
MLPYLRAIFKKSTLGKRLPGEVKGGVQGEDLMQENPGDVVAEKKAVFFDLFHTLTARESEWDEGPTTAEMLGVSQAQWHEQLHEHSRERLIGADRDPVSFIGKMAHRINPGITRETVERAVSNRIRRFESSLLRIPQVNLQALRRLRAAGKRLGLISNADVTETLAWPRSPLAPLFASAVISSAVGYMKPEPEIYKLAMRTLGVTAQEAVFVGDGSSHELEGARAVGLTPVMMAGVIRDQWPHLIEERRRHADYLIESLAELVVER